MVDFENIHVGAEVHVLRSVGDACPGKVKWKGALPRKDSLWIGVELALPIGNNSGLVGGRQYFKCRNNHGLFVSPSMIRFSNRTPRSRDTYRPISGESTADELLFSSERKHKPSNYWDPISVQNQLVKHVQGYLTSKSSLPSEARTSFHLRHLIGARVKPAKCDQPKFGLSYHNGELAGSYLKPSYYKGTHVQLDSYASDHAKYFESPPSIPRPYRQNHCCMTKRRPRKSSKAGHF